MEIERKFLIKELPQDLTQYECLEIEQAYLCTKPTIRVRKENTEYYMTYKGSGLLAREEYNLPLDEESYYHLKAKADGNIISKKRYVIPIDNGLKVELDIFDEPFAPLILAEVEFDSVEEANAFEMLPWFKEDVTNDYHYSNSYLSKSQINDLK